MLLCGDKKTRSQRSLRRYCCQRCAITRCSSVYEAALLDWLIGFYLQKLFGLSPHTVYDEPVAEMTSAVRAGHHFLKSDMVLDWELAIKKVVFSLLLVCRHRCMPQLADPACAAFSQGDVS